MTWKLLGSAAGTLALLAFLGAVDPAEAHRGGGHGGYHGGPHMFAGSQFVGPRFVGPRFVGPHHHFHHHRPIVGFYPYYYSYYYYDDCSWLRRRALYTGSPYWWERYNACRYAY